MIRSKEWKYVHRYPEGPNELFDMIHDPYEVQNLIDDPTHVDRIIEMRKGLKAWFKKYIKPEQDGSVLPVTGEGQFDLTNKGENAF